MSSMAEPASATAPPPRDPRLAEIFKKAEARHFTNEELDAIVNHRPDLKEVCETARSAREAEPEIIPRVMEEILQQYPFEDLFENPRIKLPRDWGYVIAYSSHAMVMGSPKWFDDKLLVWLKTILQAFDFPDRRPDVSTSLFEDEILEKAMTELPARCRSIYHTYYRLGQEFEEALTTPQARLFVPYLGQARATLTEPY